MGFHLAGYVFDGVTNFYEEISESEAGCWRQNYDNMYDLYDCSVGVHSCRSCLGNQ
jgi:hypothetical protein